MASLLGQFVRKLVILGGVIFVAACSSAQPSAAAPYAAYVMDARTGETLYETNADTRLHPASLTKMMTLYIAFEAIQRGEISLDTMVTISSHAANEPPSKLGMKRGQKVALRHLIRAAAIKSANDAATAIGEAISGSSEKFAQRMNRTAKAIGMRNSNFVNANGLTVKGHQSTAHDMSILGRRLFYDFPQYYNIFSRRETDAGIREVASTNRKFLDSYRGADGIKTGFTNAAGFNLTASAERDGVRIIATVFGGTSTAQRNAKMVELLDLGFAKAPRNAKTKPPAAPNYTAPPSINTDDAVQDALVAELEAQGSAVNAAKTLRLNTAVAQSVRPRARPGAAVQMAEAAAAPAPVAMAEATGATVDAMQNDIFGALAEAMGEAPPAPAQMAAADGDESLVAESIMELASNNAAPAEEPAARVASTIIHTATPIVDEVARQTAAIPSEPEVVTRISTSGGRHWGINIGRFNSRNGAERALMKTMLTESATLNEGLRKIVERSSGYDANFMGLSQEQADLACRRLQARGNQCFAIGP